MKIPPITVAPDGERLAVPGWLLHPRADHYVGYDAVVRRFYLEGDTARLEAANRFLDPVRIPFADLRIHGIAAGLIRRFDRKEARA